MIPSPMNADDIDAAGGDLKARLMGSAATGPALNLQNIGYRTVYDYGVFNTAPATNGVPNPDFRATPAGVVVMPTAGAAGTAVPFWFGESFPTGGATFAATWAELVDIAGERFLKIDQSQPDLVAGAGARLRTFITLPAALIGKTVELSFLAAGYLPDQITFANGWSATLKLDLGIDVNGLRRVSFIVPGEYVTSVNHSLNFIRAQLKAPGKYLLLGEVMVCEAVPRIGTNIQFCRIEGMPTEAQMIASVARAKEIGGAVRVMIGLDNLKFSTFTGDSPRRWQSINPNGDATKAVDRYFQLAAMAGVKLIPILIVSPTPGGAWHTLNQASSGYLDNPAVAASYVQGFVAFVQRYKGYSNIIAYDLVNEGFSPAKSQTNDLAGNYLFGYPVYEQLRRDGYAAVKAADPNARVMLTCGSGDVINGFETLLLNPAAMPADIVGYSIYNGSHPFTATPATALGARQVSVTTGKWMTAPALSRDANLNVRRFL